MTTPLRKKFRKYVLSFYYPLLFGFPLSFLMELFGENLYNDWIYMKTLSILIVIDTVLSCVFHAMKKDLSSKGFSILFTKLLIYFALLIMANLVSTLHVRGEIVEGFGWFYTLVCTSLVIREALSIVENAAKIKEDLVPLWIRKYLRDFDDNGFARRPGQGAKDINEKQRENNTITE